MSTSKPPGGQGGGAGPGNNNNNGSNYTRFIPREELRSFSAWNPGALEGAEGTRPAPGQSPAGGGVHKAPFAVRAGVAGAQTEVRPGKMPPAPAPQAASMTIGGVPGQTPAAPAAPVAEPPAPPSVDVDALARDARQAGYQDGYRDGLAALESFKQTQAVQMASFMGDRVGGLVADLQHRIETLEQQLSGRIAGVALELARQVVRSEIVLRPELVVTVAEEALAALLTSAREVTLRMNPDDYTLAQSALEDLLRQRGARLVADPHITPGGCLVESDIAVVDATVEARWARAASAMGVDSPWDGAAERGRMAPAAPAIGTDDMAETVWPQGGDAEIEGVAP